MRIQYHYCENPSKRLRNFLDYYKIPYEVAPWGDSEYMYVFDLYKDIDAYKEFKKHFPLLSRNGLGSIVYSKEEIENAKWLAVRCATTKVQWEYEEESFSRGCVRKRFFVRNLRYNHEEQTGILASTKPVRWGTRQYFSGPNAADDLLFCSEKAKNLLGTQWQGLEFWPVRKYGTLNYIFDLYQLFFAEELPIEAFVGGKPEKCRCCGKKIIRLSKGICEMAIREEYLTNPYKVYRTGSVFTYGLIGCDTISINIVSHEFYQYCEKRGMRGLIYEPIKVI